MLAFLLMNVISGQPVPGDPADIKPEIRNKAALERLGDLKQAVLIYVKGMTWKSCAIGIRVKLKRLKFVDTKRYKSGLDMDVETQLLTLALKPGQKSDDKLIAKSIWDAGYIPVEIYSLRMGKLEIRPFPELEKWTRNHCRLSGIFQNRLL